MLESYNRVPARTCVRAGANTGHTGLTSLAELLDAGVDAVGRWAR
jgi:hypothetical protein